MAQEIERKFLVQGNQWRQQASPGLVYEQAYLTDVTKDQSVRCSVRLRIVGEQANINIKSAELGISRLEFEYPITLADAKQMMMSMRIGPVIRKTRYRIGAQKGLTWEVDVFSGDNQGLVVAEIELAAEDADFERPDWLGKEVSHDPRYYNVSLLHHPYKDW
ncbi:MAG TPA: CYTH domain-containing protein [Acidiferrobacteraceae bacterium]|nr:CYTH domain-containing protein [Acidiferrobacteraceae bacterium]